MNSISQITLTNFRNYQRLKLTCSALPILIIGENGAGKTNILEAISLLSPGRGIRGAYMQDIAYHNSQEWALNADIIKGDQNYNIGVGFYENKKLIKIDHKAQSKQVALAKITKLIWLIPQMDTIFIGSRKTRLDFFDRLVFSFDVKHAQNMSEYEFAKRERTKLLRDKVFDDHWLSSLEDRMVTTGVELATARIKTRESLQDLIDAGPFRNTKILIDGAVEKSLQENNNIQEIFSTELRKNRQLDALSKRTNYGIHKSDFSAIHSLKALEAKLCSTGEQKLMLIAIVLAASKQDTILLLDDITSHLDHQNRDTLLSMILERGCQAWITDTNLQHFTEYKEQMQTFCIKAGNVVSYN